MIIICILDVWVWILLSFTCTGKLYHFFLPMMQHDFRDLFLLTFYFLFICFGWNARCFLSLFNVQNIWSSLNAYSFFFYLRWIFSLARICWAECVEIGYKCMCLCVCKLNFSRYSSIEFSIQNYKCLHIWYMFCVILCYSLLLPFFTVSSVSRV